MFQTANTVRFPGNRLRSTECVTTEAGCAPPSSKEATLFPSTKYSQVDVRCRAVNTQLKLTVEPTVLAGQFRDSSASTENWASPPSQDLSRFGPSTLCGSNWIGPQPATVPAAHSACRLGGEDTYPCAWAGEATTRVDPATRRRPTSG